MMRQISGLVFLSVIISLARSVAKIEHHAAKNVDCQDNNLSAKARRLFCAETAVTLGASWHGEQLSIPECSSNQLMFVFLPYYCLATEISRPVIIRWRDMVFERLIKQTW